MDTTRIAGDYDVRGRWLFRPDRWLDVGPARVDARAVEVDYGARDALASGVRGSADVTVHPFDLRALDRGSFMPLLSVSTDLSGVVHPFEFLEMSHRGDPELVSRPLDTPATARVVLDHGVLRPGTSIEADPARAVLRESDLSFEGTLSMKAVGRRVQRRPSRGARP